MRTIEEIFGLSKIVVLVTCEDFDLAAKACQAIIDGGLKAVSFNMYSQKDYVTLEKLIKAFPKLEIGASKIIDAAGFMSASLAGAKFISSPGMNEELYSGISTRYNDAHFLPGVINPSQIMESMSRSYRVMNLFPIELLGEQILEEYAETFPHAKFVARGNNITIENMDDFLVRSNVVGVMLNSIATKDLIASGNFDEIKLRAKAAVAKAHELLKL